MSSEHLHVRKLHVFTAPPFRGGGASVRCAITAAFPDEPLLHNHAEAGPRLPRIRYAAREGCIEIVGIEEGIPLLEELAKCLSLLRVGAEVFQVTGVELRDERLAFGETAEPVEYRFLTPWLAFNEENHRLWLRAGGAERRRLLERILIGNLLSLSKSVGHHVATRIEAQLLSWQEVPCRHKEQVLTGLRARFRATFLVPSGLALGKLASKGFGRVERVEGR